MGQQQKFTKFQLFLQLVGQMSAEQGIEIGTSKQNDSNKHCLNYFLERGNFAVQAGPKEVWQDFV